MNILITGGSGFIGSILVSKLSAQNHSIIILTRNISKTSRIFGRENNIEYCTILDQIPSSCKIDYIVNLAGARIAAFPWTPNRKQRLLESRTSTTDNIIALINRLKVKPKKLLSASAIGWYGTNCNNITVNENSKASDSSFSHTMCDQWEKSAKRATTYGVEVNILRFGIVLGARGGMLKNLSLVFKAGIGFYAGNGQQSMSWIHIEDAVNSICFLINQQAISGRDRVYNITAPFSVTNKEFSLDLAHVLHRPLVLRIPKCVIKLLLGKMGEELFLSDLSCTPQNLSKSGYQFKYNSLSDALKNIYPS